MSIRVWNVSKLSLLRLVTDSVPLAQGSTPDGVHFTLVDDNGNPVPLQTSVLARWKDGSTRRLLLDFQAKSAPDAKAALKLCWDKKAQENQYGILRCLKNDVTHRHQWHDFQRKIGGS